MNSESLTYKEEKDFKEVPQIEVKRCFVAAQYFRQHERGNTRYLRELSREDFLDRLQLSKEFVSHLSEDKLDELITEEYPKRLKTYNAVQWHRGMVYPNEVGVWKGAGGLPIEWTQGSLQETASYVIKALQADGETEVAGRAKRAISRMQKNLDLIEREPYLYPIIVPGGTMGRNYKGFKRMKGDIDDGCMRAITLISSGRTKFHAYVGVGIVKKKEL